VASILTAFMTTNKTQRFYELSLPFSRFAFFVLGQRVTMHGLENIPNDKNVLFISNHQSTLDVVMLMAKQPKRITFFAKRELSKIPFLNGDITNMGHIFVDRDNAKKSLQQLDMIKDQLEQGKNIIMFPEGTRSVTDEILPFKRGAFMLAARSKKTIIPTYIKGTNKLVSKHQFLCSPGKVDIYFGKAITEFTNLSEKEESIRLKDLLFECITELKNKSNK
jgi:1-acyl-sn-glycerol-3-phosphate acyltransferase